MSKYFISNNAETISTNNYKCTSISVFINIRYYNKRTKNMSGKPTHFVFRKTMFKCIILTRNLVIKFLISPYAIYARLDCY